MPLTPDDMKRLQAAEAWRDRRKKAMGQGAPAERIASYLFAEAEALRSAYDHIAERSRKEMKR